jgi:hypothetical protein
MFNTGEKIVCINNNDLIAEDLNFLKIGSIYIVVDSDYDSKNDIEYVGVNSIDDGLYETWFISARFIKLTEYRKQKIKQLRNV